MLALALLVLCVSIWIVVPGPVPALFILTVGATEFWPVLALINAAVAVFALRSRSRTRVAATAGAVLALLCTLVPPAAYLMVRPHVPLRALLEPWPLHDAPAAARRDPPLVLAIYGGAWQRGAPSDDAGLNARIRSWGFRVAALDYPHAPGSRWPAQREAILKQIDAIHSGRIVLLGHSSGAQLAMIAGAERSQRVSGIITYESPVDLELGYRYPSHPDIINARKIMSDLCGGTPDSVPVCYRSASPRYVVKRGMPPVLMLAAGRDHVVDLGFEHVLRDELLRDGVAVTYVELPWADHAFEKADSGFHNRIAMWYVRKFLDEIPEFKTPSRQISRAPVRFGNSI